MDGLRAAALSGPVYPERLRAALRATLVKDADQVPVFDRLFDLYFVSPGTAGARGQGDPDPANNPNGDQGDAPRDGYGDSLLDGDPDGAFGDPGLLNAMSDLAQQIARGDRGAMQIRIRQMGRRAGVENLRNFWQEGFYTYRILEQFDEEGARASIRNAIEQARAGGNPADADLLQNRLQAFEAQVRDYVARQMQQRDLEYLNRFRYNSLMDRSFYRASQDEIKLMREEVRRLAQKLKTRTTMRRKRARRGTLNVQETVRANLQTGLVPFHLKYRRKHRNKPELVVFFDLSESVRAASEFFLMFVFSLQDLFQRVRSFAFVADCVEVTDYMRTREFDRAFEDIMSARHINLYRHSDYGEAFRQFWTDYADAVTPRSVFIALGDARSNYQDHEPDLVRKLSSRAKHTLWLNPEPRGSWGLGDSVMQDYERSFKATATVSNLRQLEQVVEQLVTNL